MSRPQRTRQVTRTRAMITLLFRALTLAFIVVGCHGILSLEDKREVQNFGTNGYPGCSDGTCGACLTPAHLCQCQGKNPDCSTKSTSAVGGLHPTGDGGFDPQVCTDPHADTCAECICGSCETQLAACLNDPDCAAIFGCVGQFDCSPFPQVSNTCYAAEYCAAEIDAAGGLGSTGYAEMLGMVNCSLGANCPCNVEAPANTGCADAGTCFDQCICEGGTAGSCSAQCTGVEEDAGNDTGDGGGGPVGVCHAPGCMGCSTQGQRCLCQGGDPNTCLSDVLGTQCETYFGGDECNTCACNSCPTALLKCFEDNGCIVISQCMRITGCTGGGCDNAATCGPVLAAHGGRSGSAFTHAAALEICRTDNACSCTTMGSTDVITCDTTQCSPFTDPAASGSAVAACCYEQQGTQFCGLNVSSVLYSTCEPKAQTGRASNCPGFQAADRFPYDGAFLNGCCRPTSNDVKMNGGPGLCGYNDNVTGLGCMAPSKVDGVTATAGSCTYVP